MLTTSNIHRSISRIAIDLNDHRGKRESEVRETGAREFEVQFQIPFKATLGGDLSVGGPPPPVEKTKDLKFGVIFQGFPGGRRRSHLTKPHVRGGIELTKLPKGGGVMTYWHIVKWKQDGRKNFTDAVVLIGIARAVEHRVAKVTVEGVLHVAFQGYGYARHAHQKVDPKNCNTSVNSDE